MTQWVDMAVLALLVLTALTIVRLRGLWGAIMLTGIYSLLSASWMLVLDAPDVAFTEAAVGAGIATILMLATLSLTTQRSKPRARSPWAPLALVTIMGAALVYGTLDMTPAGDPDAVTNHHVADRYIADTVPMENGEVLEVGIPNVITTTLASYRGYDTLGETAVIFTAGIAVVLLLRGRKRKA